MNSTSIGKQAEEIVAHWLKSNHYTIIEQNWKTRWCEIDIIASNKSEIIFVEVKYRKNDSWGGGLSAISQKKVEKIEFASEFWLSTHKTKLQPRILIISLSSTPPKIDEVIYLDER